MIVPRIEKSTEGKRAHRIELVGRLFIGCA